MSFTLFCPRQPWHSTPFAPSPVICHYVVILSTCIDLVVTPGNYFVDSEVYLIIFSSMAVKGSSFPPSGVILTPNENNEYLHLTQSAKFVSILSVPRLVMLTSTSLREPNLHPFRLLLRPVMPLLAFHIHLDPGFLILEPLIIFLVIRIFFLPSLLHHLYP